MPRKLSDVKLPIRFRRLFFRTPIWLYKRGLGGLMGGRFLMLKHTGRNSGQPRQAVLQVLNLDPQAGAYLVASGFGRKFAWYLNILKTPHVSIQLVNKTMPAVVTELGPDSAGRAMVYYGNRNPLAAKQLTRLCGYEVDGGDEDYFIMGHDFIPIVAIQPQANNDNQDLP
jgi:deazaflavin-dependent oxidoreductase (nitroreductase family)